MKVDDVHLRLLEVEKFTAALRAEMGHLSKSVETLNNTVRDLSQQAQDFRVRCETEFATIRQEREEFRRWCDKNGTAELKAQNEILKDQVKRVEAVIEKYGTRAWSVVPTVVGALISGVIAAAVAFLVTKYGK